jgi:hypothetical protein
MLVFMAPMGTVIPKWWWRTRAPQRGEGRRRGRVACQQLSADDVLRELCIK